MQLNDYVQGVSAKRLSIVEVDQTRSNQHEFNGTVAMRRYLGVDRREAPARFLRIEGADDEIVESVGSVTWYDARAGHPTRSEHRMYFKDNRVMALAEAGDTLISALLPDDSMLVLVVDESSADLPDLLWFFGLPTQLDERFHTAPEEEQGQRSFAVCSMIADRIGYEVPGASNDRWIELLLERFGTEYPSTRAFSSLARQTLGEIEPVTDPDTALVRCMDREEEMFRQFERHLLAEELSQRAAEWVNDVDGFVSFSLSVQNRRKSRAGHAFENHVEWIFGMHELRFARGVTTEAKSKPDFLFPGAAEYADQSYPADQLLMLGVKTSCKDRWRQILNEAARIPTKHLLTLDPAITSDQIEEMQRSRVELVRPGPTFQTASPRPPNVRSVREFIELVQQLQGRQQGSLL